MSGYPDLNFRVGSAVPLPAVPRRCGRTWQPPWQAGFAAPAWLSSCTPFSGVHLAWLPPDMPEHTATFKLRLSGLCFLLQILNILLFAVFVRYSPESSPGQCPSQLNCSRRNPDSGFQQPREYPHGRGHRRAVLRGWLGCHPAPFRPANRQGASSCRVGLLVHPRGGKADVLQGFLKCLDRASPKKRDI